MLAGSGALRHALTFAAFACSACALPLLAVCYTAVRISKKLWMKLLANRFPHLVFVETASVRTLLDTHKNQGVFNVLMTVRGTCQPSQIRQALLDNVVDKRDRQGNLRFPKLRAGLVSCWGNYAWRTGVPFDVDSHLITGNPKFRGRPITDHNIQEYVSEIVSKHLPTNLPPWQIIIIPHVMSSDHKYCVLVRVHHLLVEDSEVLNIGDFLLLKPEEKRGFSSSCRSSPNPAQKLEESHIIESPLSNLLETPAALPNLYYRLSDSFSNRWNEFISDYDPVESPHILKNPPGVFHCSAMILIAFVSVFKEFGKNNPRNTSGDPATMLVSLIKSFKYEASRRSIAPTTLLISSFITFHPKTVILKSVQFVWWITITLWLKMPILIYYEFMALLSYIQPKYFSYPNDVVTVFNTYITLLYMAAKELAYIAELVYTAPILLFEELLWSDRNQERHQLQTMSTCGRKVVAWSHHVTAKTVRDIAGATGVSETEVLLALATDCMKEFFYQANIAVPKIVLATARTVSCDTLMASVDSVGCADKNAGVVCLSLPVGASGSKEGFGEVLRIRDEVQRVRAKQRALFALGGLRAQLAEALPGLLARVALNCSTRRFSVAITEVAEEDARPRETRWGHTCTGLLCWRPPQGNICMSLTLQRYAGVVRLGVMADALLAPEHVAPARHWSRAARRLHARLPPSLSNSPLTS